MYCRLAGRILDIVVTSSGVRGRIRRFRNICFCHDVSFVFRTISFSLSRGNSADFFLRFSSIFLRSISKLIQFSLNFFNLLQFTSCSKFLSPIFSFFSLPTLAWRLISSRRTWQTVLVHVSQCHPRYHSRRFRDTICEPFKYLKTIVGLAKSTSNHFLQFSLNFFNLL